MNTNQEKDSEEEHRGGVANTIHPGSIVISPQVAYTSCTWLEIEETYPLWQSGRNERELAYSWPYMAQLYIVNHLSHEVLWILWKHFYLISTSDFPFSRFGCDSGCGHRWGWAKYWQLRYPLPYFKPAASVAQWFPVYHQPSHWNDQSQCRWARQRGEALKTYFTCLSVLSHLTVEMVCVSNKFLFWFVWFGSVRPV